MIHYANNMTPDSDDDVAATGSSDDQENRENRADEEQGKAQHKKPGSDVNDVPVLRRAAMDFLARREHSLLELQRKLTQKFPDQDRDLIDQVLDDLRSENLQSDERFVESYVRYRRSRGFGYLHIKADIQARGVSESLVDHYLHHDDDGWLLSVEELLNRKLGEQGRLEFGSKEHRKILRFLESRGFTASQIRRAVDARLYSN